MANELTPGVLVVLLACLRMMYTPDQLVLEDLSFTTDAGHVAAFVGQTGGDKTTIVSLVARFYDPISGAAKIDGTDILQGPRGGFSWA